MKVKARSVVSLLPLLLSVVTAYKDYRELLFLKNLPENVKRGGYNAFKNYLLGGSSPQIDKRQGINLFKSRVMSGPGISFLKRPDYNYYKNNVLSRMHPEYNSLMDRFDSEGTFNQRLGYYRKYLENRGASDDLYEAPSFDLKSDNQRSSHNLYKDLMLSKPQNEESFEDYDLRDMFPEHQANSVEDDDLLSKRGFRVLMNLLNSKKLDNSKPLSITKCQNSEPKEEKRGTGYRSMKMQTGKTDNGVEEAIPCKLTEELPSSGLEPKIKAVPQKK